MKNEYLRHTLSAIAYRFQKSVVSTKDDFGAFSAGMGSRTPCEIINHMYEVLKAAKIIVQERKYEKKSPEKLDFKLEIERFYEELKSIDEILSEKEVKVKNAKRLLQGPLSDILTHIGQIAMLCRLFNHPIKGEDYSSASIQTGKY